ncbi:MAG TPA: folate-binding protein [Methylococcales bacterium]|nr:folate-binding protein [Methylococcales bacterium]
MQEHSSRFLSALGFNPSATQDPSAPFLNQPRLYCLDHLTVLTLSGQDASTLLQGQSTCNVTDATDQLSLLGSFCSVKGRVISTFLLLKKHDEFQLILPADLAESISKRLKMYVLRADVKIHINQEETGLFGLTDHSTAPHLPVNDYQTSPFNDNAAIVKLPSAATPRFIFIGSRESARTLFKQMGTTHRDFSPALAWKFLDTTAGIPTITPATSETWIPQSINLDTLGAISFKKGCYTGQEIIARTHYKGKAKASMHQVNLPTNATITPGLKLFNLDSDSNQSIGEVVNALQTESVWQLLVSIKNEQINAKKIFIEGNELDFISWQ